VDTSWKKTDTSAPEYKRKVIFYTVLTMVFGIIGSALLAYKIDSAEKAQAEKRAEQAQIQK
jgi:sensor histidine kinase regulating citrate/malate metabolism